MARPHSIFRQSPLAEAMGLVCFAGAVLVRLAVDSVALPPFITFFPAVFVATMMGGLRSGVICTAFSTVTAWYFWIPQRHSLLFDDWLSAASVILFVIGCALILYLAQSRDNSAKALAQARDKSLVLFQELQHRVANNLMFMSAVIEIQRRSLPLSDSCASDILDETAKRLAALGDIHRELYDPALASRPFKDLLHAICTRLSQISNRENVDIEVSGSEACVDLRRAIPIALIVNEAVTNSLKYAFPDGQAGEITINFEQQGVNLRLVISDNGVGMSDFEKSSGIGGKILAALASQLESELRVETGHHGTTMTLQVEA